MLITQIVLLHFYFECLICYQYGKVSSDVCQSCSRWWISHHVLKWMTPGKTMSAMRLINFKILQPSSYNWFFMCCLDSLADGSAAIQRWWKSEHWISGGELDIWFWQEWWAQLCRVGLHHSASSFGFTCLGVYTKLASWFKGLETKWRRINGLDIPLCANKMFKPGYNEYDCCFG